AELQSIHLPPFCLVRNTGTLRLRCNKVHLESGVKVAELDLDMNDGNTVPDVHAGDRDSGPPNPRIPIQPDADLRIASAVLGNFSVIDCPAQAQQSLSGASLVQTLSLGTNCHICHNASSPNSARFGNNKGAKGGAPWTKLSKAWMDGPTRLALAWSTNPQMPT